MSQWKCLTTLISSDVPYLMISLSSSQEVSHVNCCHQWINFCFQYFFKSLLLLPLSLPPSPVTRLPLLSSLSFFPLSPNLSQRDWTDSRAGSGLGTIKSLYLHSPPSPPNTKLYLHFNQLISINVSEEEHREQSTTWIWVLLLLVLHKRTRTRW